MKPFQTTLQYNKFVDISFINGVDISIPLAGKQKGNRKSPNQIQAERSRISWVRSE